MFACLIFTASFSQRIYQAKFKKTRIYAHVARKSSVFIEDEGKYGKTMAIVGRYCRKTRYRFLLLTCLQSQFLLHNLETVFLIYNDGKTGVLWMLMNFQVTISITWNGSEDRSQEWRLKRTSKRKWMLAKIQLDIDRFLTEEYHEKWQINVTIYNKVETTSSPC